MTRTEMGKMLSSIAALVVSYAAAFWLLTLPHHGLAVPARIGYVSSVFSVLGVGVYFWATILAPVARKRQWSPRECQLIPLVTMAPALVFLFLFADGSMQTGNLLFYQPMLTGFLLVKFVHPDFYKSGPFERNPQNTLFPK
jgi:hypothetical protein